MKSLKANQKDLFCEFCHDKIEGHLGEHLRKNHGKKAFRKSVLEAKRGGMTDPDIGDRFGVRLKELERIILEAYGVNISSLKDHKKVTSLEPKGFKEERTSVWSFKQRGGWATHDARYRGNWSPYIPRNVILKYSQPGETVLDYFTGGGTTAVEAKLLGRRCTVFDINPYAIELTHNNLEFDIPQQDPLFKDTRFYEPEASVGDARNLDSINDNSIGLICAHPPYAGIIGYSSENKDDLSLLSVEGFLQEMAKVADESYRVLKPGHQCAILIGDTRVKKRIVPIGFQTIKVFLDAGFKLRDLVIKRQHNCRATGFWYTKSVKFNFLLLAHEYLPVFEKPKQPTTQINQKSEKQVVFSIRLKPIQEVNKKTLESTSVWVLPTAKLDGEIERNLVQRFGESGGKAVEIKMGKNIEKVSVSINESQVLFIRYPEGLFDIRYVDDYIEQLAELAQSTVDNLAIGGALVLEVQDVRIDGYVYPAGLNVFEKMNRVKDLAIKEIIMVVTENSNSNDTPSSEYLDIVHRYLLVYIKQ